MPRDLAGLRYRNRAREQKPAAVAGIADALGDAGEVSDRGGLEGVLQQDRGIELDAGEARARRPIFQPTDRGV